MCLALGNTQHFIAVVPLLFFMPRVQGLASAWKLCQGEVEEECEASEIAPHVTPLTQ